jgi:hypothetical protein
LGAAFAASRAATPSRKSRHERERAEDVLGNALRHIKPRDAA